MELVKVEFRYGIPGVLVTSGIALLALSVLNASLFSLGVKLLFLGILGFLAVGLFDAIIDLSEARQEATLEGWEQALLVARILGAVAVGVIVFLIFEPLLGV